MKGNECLALPGTFPLFLSFGFYNPWCKGHKCDEFLSLTISLCFSDTFMLVSINKLSSGTYIFQNLTSYLEITDTFQLWEKSITTFILSYYRYLISKYNDGHGTFQKKDNLLLLYDSYVYLFFRL